MTIVVNGDDFKRAFERKGAEFLKNMRGAFDSAGVHMVGLAQDQAKGKGVRDRSGKLAASFNHKVWHANGAPRSIRMRVFSSGVPYANMMEFGKQGHKAKKPGGFLTIPLPDARASSGGKTGKGVSRARARMFPEAFFINLGVRPNTPSDMKGIGSLFLVEKNQSGGLDWLFQLRKSVDIPGKLGYFKTWNDAGRAFFRKEVRFAVAEALKA